jgi:hypothetical protein
MNLTGKLIRVGEDETGLCRAIVQLDPSEVAKIDQLPMFEQVEIVPAPNAYALKLFNAVNSSCTCGGKPADDPDACPACMVWHRLNS